MKVKQVFVVVFGLMVVAVGISIAVSFVLLQEISGFQEAANTRYLSYQRADELRQSSDDLTRLARTYVVTGDPRYKKMYEDVLAIRNGEKPRPERYHTIYWDLVLDYGDKPKPDGERVALQDAMKELGFTEEEFALLKEANSNSDKLVNTEVEAFESVANGRQQHAVEIMHDIAYHKEKAKIMEPIERFFVELEDRSQQQVLDSKSAVNRLMIILTALLIGVGILAICGYLFIVKKVAAPIDNLSGTIEAVEREADLTRVSSLRGRDEVSTMGQSFNKMMAKIRNLVNEAVKIAKNVDDSATHTREFAGSTSERMGKQAREIDMVATAVNEMSAALEEVARNTNEAASVADEAYTHVESGKEVVNDSLENMHELLTQMTETSSSVDELAQNFRQIEGVLDVIKSIAEQTNLLALNAAIESARAGESGRGFAVVADEVRTLAQRTQESTGEIESMIASLSQGMHQTTSAIEEGMNRVNASNDTVTRTSEILEMIVASVNRIRDMNAQVATATEEQSNAVESINESVLEVKNLADETSGSAQGLEVNSEQLKTAAGDLVKQVEVFKV
ncbi:methyl-accepting chemotaxis protein [Arhodomonas sp. AD133]|uniref:methyl-accepting chemotaxis protein n=1 Tax=Arhodomonas sp. AD133 TaxID=3415009 RepID=UPI003EB71407